MKTILTAAIALFLAGTAGAADYHIYTDGSGKTVLSNVAPPASARIVARHNLTDATEAEIAATEKSNLEIAKLNALSDLAASYDRLAEAIIVASVPRPVSLEINQVAVGIGQSRLRRGPAHVRPMSY
jgi:hypothetical protein